MKKFLFIILSIVFVVGITACSNQTNVVEETKVEVEEPKELGIEPQNVEVTIFDVVENKDIEKVLELENPSPENIAKTIMKELGYIGDEINSVKEKENAVYIDFSEKSKFLKGGTAEETAVLDSLGLTFVGNLKYDHIYVSVEGNAYESGHMYFELNEPYM